MQGKNQDNDRRVQWVPKGDHAMLYVHPARVHGATRPCGCDKCRTRRMKRVSK